MCYDTAQLYNCLVLLLPMICTTQNGPHVAETLSHVSHLLDLTQQLQHLLAVGTLLLAKANHCNTATTFSISILLLNMKLMQAATMMKVLNVNSARNRDAEILFAPCCIVFGACCMVQTPTPHAKHAILPRLQIRTNVNETAVVLDALHGTACGLLLLLLLGDLGGLATHLTGTGE